jgi:hypothetical protein
MAHISVQSNRAYLCARTQLAFLLARVRVEFRPRVRSARRGEQWSALLPRIHVMGRTTPRCRVRSATCTLHHLLPVNISRSHGRHTHGRVSHVAMSHHWPHVMRRQSPLVRRWAGLHHLVWMHRHSRRCAMRTRG